jgi:lipid II:glycine glycyltransferase (peptidoglycan interpeptide bridge formation enzyme)
MARGFRASPLQLAPTATVLVDLSKPPDVLLSEMRSGTRRGIRVGLASGLTVRRGTERDLAVFHALLRASARRHRFAPAPEAYFRRMWEIFSPSDDIALFLAELRGEAVAAELDITFGDTLVSKRAGWSGRHRRLHPNELLVWTSLTWARERGLKYFDLEGLEPRLARTVASGDPVPDRARQTPDWFKLGFGGSVVLLPASYEFVYAPTLGWAHRMVPSQLTDVPWLHRFEQKIAGRLA